MEPINEINFGAKPLNKIKIKKYNAGNKKFMSIPARFVVLDSKNSKDAEAIKYISKKWKKAKYINEITTASNWMSSNRYIKIYALTEQKENFDKLSPRKIIGLAEIREEQEEGNYLSHIQVNPSAININSKSDKYKKVGSSILKSLKKIYDVITLESINNEDIENFYRNNGFIEYYDTKGFFVWYRNIFKRFDMILRNFLIKHKMLSNLPER